MTVRYSLGQHRLVASGRCVALLPSGLDDALLADIWTEVSTASDLLRVMDVLLSRGLGTVPNFAVAMIGEHGVQVIVRGSGRAYGSGAWHDSGGRATWSEIDLPGPSVTLSLDDAGEPEPRIPLLGGVVLAGSVAVEVEHSDSSRPAGPQSHSAPSVAVGAGVDLSAGALNAEANGGPAGVPQVSAVPSPERGGASEVDLESGAMVDELPEPAPAPEPTPEPDPPAEAEAEAADEGEDEDEDSYDRLFELTYHGVSPSAVPADVLAANPVPATAASAEPADGSEELINDPDIDHPDDLVDALVDDDDMPELTVVRPPDPPARSTPQPSMNAVGPLVSALRCPRGHLNPPGTSVCRVCASGIGPQTPSQVPRPPLGVLLATEAVPGAPRRISLDSDLLIGRRPAHGPVPDQGVRLVTIPSPEKDISRRHLRVSLDGWAVLITDLGSTNGTTVSLPGRTAREVRSGEVVPIVAGTRVTLADVATYVFEVE